MAILFNIKTNCLFEGYMSAAVNSEAGMKQISKWQEAHEFAGRFVAYRTNSSYFGSKEAYAMSNNGDCFGYICKKPKKWRNYNFSHPNPSKWVGEQETGYNLNRLVKPSVINTVCALIDSKLSKDPIFLRLATAEEADQINSTVSRKPEAAYLEPYFIDFDDNQFSEAVKAHQLSLTKA